MTQRSVLVKYATSTGCGCAMPGVQAALWRERFEKAALARARGRRKPVRTKVARYVDVRAPMLARRLKEIMKGHARVIAAKVVAKWAHRIADLHAKRFGKRLEDDPEDIEAFIDETLAELDIDDLADELGISDMVYDMMDAMASELRAAYKQAALVGVTEVQQGIVSGTQLTQDMLDATGLAPPAAVVAGGTEALSADTELSTMTNQIDANALQFAQDRAGELIKDLAGTTMDDLRSFLTEAVAAGLSPEDLSDGIQEMGAFGDYRGDMIARTELAFAHVNGNVDGWRQTGQVDGKESILGDNHDIDDECDDCANAGIRQLDEDFIEGYSFPPYHPNCVCDVQPVLAEDMPDGGSGDGSGDGSDGGDGENA